MGYVIIILYEFDVGYHESGYEGKNVFVNHASFDEFLNGDFCSALDDDLSSALYFNLYELLLTLFII